jgi:hypothetical protein
MAENKKKIVVYADWIETFEALEDDEAGRLVKHLFRYVNDMNPTSDKLTEIAFTPIKQTLKRDLQKYLDACERNSQNGSKGGRPKKTEINPTKANGLNKNPTKAKKADSDSDSDSDSNKAIKVIPTIEEFLALALASKPNVNQEDVKLKYQSWVVNDWSVTRGTKTNPIKNWKSTLLNTIPFFGVVAPEYKSPHQKEYEHIMKEVNAENERQRLLKLENDTN